MTPPKTIKITKAKGRPMLQWVGKKPLTTAPVYPAQHVESFRLELPAAALADISWREWPDKYPHGGLLFHGDNKDVLAHLLANGFRGKVKLIYIDPPFDSGADYVRKVNLRGTVSAKLDGEDYSLGEQVQYTDIWANDNYLQFMYERLLLLKGLLADDGVLFLHCDWKRIHFLRCLLDEVFGAENFRNEIVRVKCNPKNSKRKAFGNIHDALLFYVNGDADRITWNPQRESVDSEDMDRLFNKVDSAGRKYTTVALHARGIRKGETGKPWRGINPPFGRHWAYKHAELDRFDDEKLLEWSSTNNPRLIRYADEKDGDLVQDIWTMKDPVEDDYPTEKPEELLQRIISAATQCGDIVLDCFLGSGTTAAVAQKLGRRWIGCDINKGAIQTTAKRLQGILAGQAKTEASAANRQTSLLPDEDEAAPRPAQSAFTVWRVNDYDLQIQHNEAVQLVAEHLGIQRLKSDGFFDGVRTQRLVKIIPFNHPLTPLDLDSIKQELASRPGEERDVQVVALGMELAAKTWLEQHNRNRPINRFHLIELRTDKKYGGIIQHEPATADIAIWRETKAGKERLVVEILDVVSPSIIQRLNLDVSLFRAQIPEWRAMVDCVLIDSAYDGHVFNVCLSDVPERKQDYVQGRYELPAPPVGATVAVKVIDMLGEEIGVVKEV